MGSLYFLPYSANYPSAGSDYKNKASGTWANYKKNFVDAYVTSHPGNYLVHNPQMVDDPSTATFDETEGATSEAQGYGLLLALYNNDQAYFDNILTSVYAKMYNKDGKGLFASTVDKSGNVGTDLSSATSGDTFITLALVFADILVKHGYWTDTSNGYGSKAQSLIDDIYANDVDSGKYLLPGDGWSGKDASSPSSFFTAALKTFKFYETNMHDWDTVVDQCYTTLQSVHPGTIDGYFYGLSPDMSTRTGGVSAYGTTGPSGNGSDMWYDAIRTPWMMSADAIWFSDARAVQYCQNGMNFLTGLYGDETSAASNAIQYAMNGTPYTSDDGAWHSELTAGMWGTGAMGSGLSASKSAFNAEFESNFSQNAAAANGGYWGNWSGEGNYYYNQTMASFAALLMAGNFVNVYKDLEAAPDTTPPTDTVVTDDGANTASLTELHATWTASSDAESGVSEYQYSISTDPADPATGNIVPWTSAGTNTDITATGLSLVNGTTYYFHVKAKNGAGLWSNVSSSDGITVNVDLTAPSNPVVTDDGASTTSLSQLHASWASSDPESGITEYQYAISTDPNDAAVGTIVDWSSVGTATEITETGMALTNGTTYYFHVKALNGAGLWSNVGSSDGITVNNTSNGLYYLCYSANYPTAGSNYKDKVGGTWANYKKNFIDAYSTGLVHNPQMMDDESTAGFDETEGATSEAQGYGLLLAIYNSDQVYFDKILTAAYAKMHDNSGSGKGLFASIVDKFGNLNGSNYSSTTSGDTFITLALIFADTLIKKGCWTDTGNNYSSKAQDLIDNIYANDVESGKYLMPGDEWGGKDAANPSYFFTGALKTFKYYQANFHDWDAVVDQCYATIQSSQGYSFGLSPDLSTRAGGISTFGTTGPSGNGSDMWYDAIRTPWMMAADAIWFNDPRAVQYCQNGMNFLSSLYGDETSAAQGSILYKNDGNPYGDDDGAFHNELTGGMWGTGAMGSGLKTSQSAFNAEFESNFSQNATAAKGGYWGNWTGVGNYYYNQSLASFAALLMSGNFVNVYKDLVMMADTTPPSDPAVTDDGKYTLSLSQLHASWTPSTDTDSGVIEYQYSISTDPTDPDAGNIVPWTSTGTGTDITATGLSLTDGATYYFHVKAKNGAGLWSNVSSSNGITADTTAPSVPVVTDDGKYSISSTQIHATFSSSDAESGIADYQYAISTDPKDASVGNIVPWTSTGGDTAITATNLSLTSGTTYYVHIKAVNGEGLESVGHSDGIIVDATAPSDPVVTDDGINTASLSQLHASWASSDAESGITEYQYAISTDPTDPAIGNIVPWTSTGTRTDITANGLSLVNGSTYYFHVKAIDGAGQWSNVGSSDGITVSVDTTAPSDPIVSDDGIYTNNASQLHGAWSSSDNESGITEYQYAISTDPTDPATGNIVPWTSAGTDTQVTATGLSLANATTYYFHVKAKNGAGLWSNVGSSDGITVNNTVGSLYYLCYSANYPTAGSDYKDKIGGTWANYKKNFIDAYSTGLVHNPQMIDDETTVGFDETEGATSEAQGYGLLLALYNGDQTYFDKILTAAYAKMHNKDGKGLFASKVDKSGNTGSDYSSATDGDIFITLALVFADTLIKHGCWSDTGNNYDSKAQNLINNIYANDVESGKYLMPGDGWTGKDAANPSYFFTAALKTFKYYQSTFHDWTAVVDQCYATIQSSQGYANGLTPDLSTRDGKVSPLGTTGPSGNGSDMWYDAIRTPWMMAVDAIWFNDPRAVQYCQNGMNYLSGYYGSEASAAGNSILYKMDGAPYKNDDGAWHSEITAGMWGTGAMGSGLLASKSAFNTEFEGNFSQNATAANGGYWGNTSETGVANYYYNQSLASFAALLMSGNFVNVYKDLVKTPDITPPSDPAVTDDGAYTIVPSQLHAVLSPSSDPESEIKEYQYAISTDPTDPAKGTVVDWTSTGPNTTDINVNGLSLTNGQTYYFHVKAINGEGLVSNVVHSDGIMVDSTAPTNPIVIDDGTYTTSPSQINASWSSADPESGITEFRYAISTDPNDAKMGDPENITPWTSAGMSTSVAVTGLSLEDGKTYYIHVQALDAAGQWSSVGHSDGIMVDTTPPSDPNVSGSIEKSGSAANLKAVWASSDEQSGVTEYQYSISTDPKDTNIGDPETIVPWTSAGTNTKVTVENLDLSGLRSYYFHVKAKNGAGLWSNVGSSDGLQIGIVDTTSPSDPAVTDSGEYSKSADHLTAVLSPSNDEESGITEYQYAISTDPTDPMIGLAENARPWTSVGPDTTKISANGLELDNGKTYYFHVRAVNGVGMKSNIVHSDGITVDTTAPTTPIVTDDGTYTTSTSEFHAAWDSSDAESGITEYQYTISTDPTDAETGKIINWTSAGTNTKVTVTGLSLNRGTTYYFHVEAKNGAGEWSEIGHSDGITVGYVKTNAYPNPLGSDQDLHVSFMLENDGEVSIKIYDIWGKILKNVELGTQTKGSYDKTIANGSELASGVSFVQIQADHKVLATIKIVRK